MLEEEQELCWKALCPVEPGPALQLQGIPCEYEQRAHWQFSSGHLGSLKACPHVESDTHLWLVLEDAYQSKIT